MHFGVFNTSKKSSLSNLVLEVSEENVFVNCEREIKVKGYDKNYNPVEIDTDDIKWTTSGVDGKIKDNTLIAGNEAGTIKITAQIGKVKGNISIDVLSTPNEITISPRISNTEKNEKVKLNITAKNKNGYYASIKNSELSWKILSGEGKFEDGTYTPTSSGVHLLEISAGNAKSYAIVNVSETFENYIDYISNNNFNFVSYPSEVTGNIEKINKNFVQLNYDFSNTTATRAAYLRFNEPIVLNEKALSISFDIISKETISDYIKVKIIDAEGTSKLIMIQRAFDGSNETQTLNLSLSNISLPATLTDIYIGQDTEDILSKGNIQIGNITISEKTASTNELVVPKSIKGLDSANKTSTSSGDNTIKIAVFDEISKPTILLDKLKKSKLENELNKNSDIIILTSQEKENDVSNLNKTIINTSVYNKTSFKNLDIITLDVTNGGLRTTDYTSWLNLQNDITNSENKNILIVMNGNLEDFTDENEKKLFIDVICELRRSNSKNIWVICNDDYTDYSMERGVKYLSVNNTNQNTSDLLEIAKNTSYILITIENDNISYEIKKLF